jgi:hypothetical protein
MAVMTNKRTGNLALEICDDRLRGGWAMDTHNIKNISGMIAPAMDAPRTYMSARNSECALIIPRTNKIQQLMEEENRAKALFWERDGFVENIIKQVKVLMINMVVRMVLVVSI